MKKPVENEINNKTLKTLDKCSNLRFLWKIVEQELNRFVVSCNYTPKMNLYFYYLILWVGRPIRNEIIQFNNVLI